MQALQQFSQLIFFFQHIGPASSYPLAIAPFLPGSFSPIASRISAEVLTGDTPLVYITTKDAQNAWKRASDNQLSTKKDVEASNHWDTQIHGVGNQQNTDKVRRGSFLTLNPSTIQRDEIPCPSTHLPTVASSIMNHIAPGLHQTSLTLASPVLGCVGNLAKDRASLTVEDPWRDHRSPYIRRRSVNVPLDTSNDKK